MKQKVLVISMFICVCQLSLAQEPRPDWVRNTPFPPTDANYIFVYGMGVGITEQDAEFSAWKNALYKALNEGGLVGIKAQSQTLDQIFTMKDLETKLPANVLQRRLACQTLPIYLSEKEVKVYVLLQVQRDGSRSADFYSHDLNFITCETATFLEELEKYNKRVMDKLKIERENAEKLKGENALFANGNQVLRNGKELNENEVRTLFANTESYKLYDLGMRLTRDNSMWYGIGGTVIGMGALFQLGWLGKNSEDAAAFTTLAKVGLGLVGGGAALIVIGSSRDLSGNAKIRKAVDLYNNGKMYSSLPVELKFGLTQNGLGIALNF